MAGVLGFKLNGNRWVKTSCSICFEIFPCLEHHTVGARFQEGARIQQVAYATIGVCDTTYNFCHIIKITQVEEVYR